MLHLACCVQRAVSCELYVLSCELQAASCELRRAFIRCRTVCKCMSEASAIGDGPCLPRVVCCTLSVGALSAARRLLARCHARCCLLVRRLLSFAVPCTGVHSERPPSSGTLRRALYAKAGLRPRRIGPSGAEACVSKCASSARRGRETTLFPSWANNSSGLVHAHENDNGCVSGSGRHRLTKRVVGCNE